MPGGSEGKASACNAGDLGLTPGWGRFPWRRKWQPPPVFLPFFPILATGKPHGWRSLVGYSPWSRKELDTTERLHFHFQTMVQVMKIMATSFRRSHAGTAILSAPNPPAGHCRLMPLLETPGHSQTNLGQCLVGSLLLSPRSWCTRFCRALREAVSQSCVTSGCSVVGLMALSSKRAYSMPRSAAPVSAAAHC